MDDADAPPPDLFVVQDQAVGSAAYELGEVALTVRAQGPPDRFLGTTRHEGGEERGEGRRERDRHERQDGPPPDAFKKSWKSL
ncbi:hypothetical protein [Planobispora longispora]|uniref:Uncharacterized protein n=1 Tax=Planobispora longispora TaxID=28887 RepID=A0A8J3RP94_9ACTN|nr:hypothetical protein [Planobispora longispora]GIH79297.1 hypothetical protein Plo01_57260 [Planobispora longispora]